MFSRSVLDECLMGPKHAEPVSFSVSTGNYRNAVTRDRFRSTLAIITGNLLTEIGLSVISISQQQQQQLSAVSAVMTA